MCGHFTGPILCQAASVYVVTSGGTHLLLLRWRLWSGLQDRALNVDELYFLRAGCYHPV